MSAASLLSSFIRIIFARSTYLFRNLRFLRWGGPTSPAKGALLWRACKFFR